MISFNCPGCDTVFQVGDEHRGRQAKCPKCSTVTRVGSLPPPLPQPQLSNPAMPPQPRQSTGGVSRTVLAEPRRLVLACVVLLLAIVAIGGVGAYVASERDKQDEQKASQQRATEAVAREAMKVVVRQAAAELQQLKAAIVRDEEEQSELNKKIVLARLAIGGANLGHQRAAPGSFKELTAQILGTGAQSALDGLLVDQSRLESKLTAERDRYNRLQNEQSQIDGTFGRFQTTSAE